MINPYAVIYLAAYMVPAAVGFVALILYTHLLSPAEYGIYVVGVSIAGIVSALFFTWVRLSVARFQARSPELDMHADAAAAYGLTVVVLAALLPIALLIFRPSIGIGLIMASVFVALTNTAFDISMEFKRAQLNALRFATISLLRSLLGLTLGYTAIRFGGGGLGLLFGFGSSFLIANVLSVQANPLRSLRNFAAPRLVQFIRYGMPFSMGALVIALHNALDRLGVAYLLGESAAGCYGLAADLPRQITNLFGNSVASALFPITFRSMAEKGPAATRERLKEGAELLLALIAPAAVWLSISANLVAGTLLGSEFQTGVIALLPLLAVGRVCGAFNQFYLQVSFQLAERPMLQVVHDASVLIINISLLLPLTFVFWTDRRRGGGGGGGSARHRHRPFAVAPRLPDSFQRLGHGARLCGHRDHGGGDVRGKNGGARARDSGAHRSRRRRRHCVRGCGAAVRPRRHSHHHYLNDGAADLAPFLAVELVRRR